jgi:hypothetical protein
MQTVFYHATELFCFCLLIHIFVWRVFPVKHQGVRLGLIFSLGAALIISIHALAARLAPATFQPVDWALWGLACLLHFALFGVYLNLYTAVTGFSPSIGILERVEESMPRGLARDQLAPPWFTDKNLSGARRDNLLETGFIHESAGCLRLSPRGRLIATCFLVFRRFLGLPDIAKG